MAVTGHYFFDRWVRILIYAQALYKLIHWIDDLADYAEKLAIRTRLLIVR